MTIKEQFNQFFPNFTLLPSLSCSLKTTNHGMREDIFCTYGCLKLSGYIKGDKKTVSLDIIVFLVTHFCTNNPY